MSFMIEQVHKGGDIMITKAEESQRNGSYNNGNSSGNEKKNGINTHLQRYSLNSFITLYIFCYVRNFHNGSIYTQM